MHLLECKLALMRYPPYTLARLHSSCCQLGCVYGNGNLRRKPPELYAISADRAMLCTGTPGVGKTMLLPYLMHFLAAREATVVLWSKECVEKFLFSR